MAQMVKNLPAIEEIQIQSLGQEDPLEKGMATHSSILAWRIPRTEEPGRLQSMGLKESDMTEWLTLSLSFNKTKNNISESWKVDRDFKCSDWTSGSAEAKGADLSYLWS